MNRPSPIKQEIVRQGRVQADVALEAGISESRMSRIVNRRVAIQEHERRHLARVLGINLEETSDEHSTPQ
jgi:ribosome-binding protein aMBF1 (putative translation factor)|tara:strand:+ start:129 stop:338 length:210 start_codon:yes stop_codon:yes gene_type:complete